MWEQKKKAFVPPTGYISLFVSLSPREDRHENKDEESGKQGATRNS